jgi:hypothetical protein
LAPQLASDTPREGQGRAGQSACEGKEKARKTELFGTVKDQSGWRSPRFQDRCLKPLGHPSNELKSLFFF